VAATKETIMNTQISSKLVALAVALMMNTLIIGGVAVLFNDQAQLRSAPTSLAQVAADAAYRA
jgi:hypothetical protein